MTSINHSNSVRRSGSISAASGRVKQLIAELDLKPHVEGGYFREYYRAGCQYPLGAGGRSCSTAIYYLLEGGSCSAFHRLDADEIWHFYEGSPLHLHLLGENGHTPLRLGAGACFSALVPAGTWIAAEPGEDSGYSLAGCTVAPGFEFEGFEIAERKDLLDKFPEQAELIERLTRP